MTRQPTKHLPEKELQEYPAGKPGELDRIFLTCQGKCEGIQVERRGAMEDGGGLDQRQGKASATSRWALSFIGTPSNNKLQGMVHHETTSSLRRMQDLIGRSTSSVEHSKEADAWGGKRN